MSSLRLWQFCSTASHISRHNGRLSRKHSYTGSLERKHKWCWWWQRLLVWHPCWSDLSAVEWICKQRKTVQGVIKGCRCNQPQSAVLASYTVRACNSLFITHLHLYLQRDGDPERQPKTAVLSLQTAVMGCNEAIEFLPWKPWRNLEPSGSSSGVYSLYPPTKSWLKTLRPTRGPGDDPVRLRCPSTWERHNKMSILKLESYICRRQCGNTIYLKLTKCMTLHWVFADHVNLLAAVGTALHCHVFFSEQTKFFEASIPGPIEWALTR